MSGDSPFARRVRARLDGLRAVGLQRRLQAPGGIDLSSNDYLNLSRHPQLVAAMVDGAHSEGCGSTGSRLLRGHRDAFAAVERRFASFKSTESALYFSSGYLANLAVLTTLPQAGDTIFSDAANHASLIDGTRLSRAAHVVFPHNDVEWLGQALATTARGSADARVSFVVIESLFSMDGDEAPLVELAALCRRSGAVLVVDEAHAVGVFGTRGSGLIEEAAVDGDVCVSINTAGKALGVGGAFVAGPAWAIEYLVQSARPFVFSTAPPPALARALEASIEIVEREPERRAAVRDAARHLRDRLRVAGVETGAGRGQIIPVVLGDNDRAVTVAAALQAQGFDVRAIRPPTVPPGTARLRVSVNAAMDRATLDRFAAALVQAVQQVPACSAASS